MRFRRGSCGSLDFPQGPRKNRRAMQIFLFPLLLLAALAGSPLQAAPPDNVLQLVETAPVETTLDHPDIPDAWQVWPQMIDGAAKTLDFSEFYAATPPAGAASRLDPVLAAIERAAGRGVRVRFLLDRRFIQIYPETVTRLRAIEGTEVRVIDFGALAGGVQHAKYFLVDGREAYVGSQNFDWRSLEHIQELGVRVAQPAVAKFLADVFATDWSLAGGAAKSFRVKPPAGGYGFPVRIGPAAVVAVASPQGWLPDEKSWELPELVKMIDGARSRVRVQLLNYRAAARDGVYWDALEAALRRAAARKVQVELLLADWSQSAGTIEGLQSLEPLPNLAVRLVTIPQASTGFIPFARVVHAKYLVVDGERAWIGTGNWERDYFFNSRNVGLIVDSPLLGGQLDRFFTDLWGSPYAKPVDPCAQYKAVDAAGPGGS